MSAADLGGRPAPPEVSTGPRGTVTDSSGGGNGIPSDAAADSSPGGVQQVDVPDVRATGPKQDDAGFGAATGLPVESAQAVASAQSGASIASSRNFAGDFNSGNLGSTQPRLGGAPAWGGSGRPSGDVAVNWLNADVNVIPRRWAGNWFSAVSGIGARQLVTIVYSDWSAQLRSWGPDPIYRAVRFFFFRLT